MVVVQVQGACCDILSHASVKEKRKKKEKKRILNIDLAVKASQWLREAVYDSHFSWVVFCILLRMDKSIDLVSAVI